ncbi:MAG: hypothetical protein GY854_30965 [Deltaproteobacteria bacterium]|nr:hypothetical protein [Deltaproteobacteria bacterium]
MKIKRTTGHDRTKDAVGPIKKAESPQRSSKTASKDISDTVSLSLDAVAAHRAGDIEVSSAEEIQQVTSIDGALPDPRATSQAILEKELAQVFREIYL